MEVEMEMVEEGEEEDEEEFLGRKTRINFLSFVDGIHLNRRKAFMSLKTSCSDSFGTMKRTEYTVFTGYIRSA